MKKPASNRLNSSPLSGKLVLLCYALVCAQAVTRASDYTWDATAGTAGLQDGAGSWGTVGTATAAQHWSLNGTGAAISWPNNAADNATIGANNGAAGVITVTSGQTISVSNITFNAAGSGGYTISPGASSTTRLNFSPNATVTVASGIIVTSTCPLLGNGFTKAGDGTFYLRPATDASNYTGLVVVNAGTLIANGGSSGRYAISTGGVKINAGTLQFGIGGNSSDASLQDTASVTNAGGVVDFEVNDAFGSLVLESGTLTNGYTGGNRTITPSSVILLQSGTILGNSSQNLRIAGAAPVTKTTPATVTLGPFFTAFWSNTTTISQGTLALVGNATIANTTNITVAAGAALDLSGLSSFALGAAQTLAGSGTVTGNVSMAIGAKVQPGTNALRLTIRGNLTLNTNVVVIDAGGSTIPVGFYRVIDYTGTKTGPFSPTPTIINGSTADTAAVDDTSAPGRVYLTVGACLPPTIDTNPADQTGYAQSTATFTLLALGTSPTFQWQVSTDSGTTFNNVTGGSGGTSASYTTPLLSGGDVGTQFRCIASVACDGLSVTSSPAALTAVLAPSEFRSKQSGNWNVLSTWQQSSDGGATWPDAASLPTAANSTNILIQTGHSVTNTAALVIDDTVVQSGAALVVSGGALTINDGAAAFDCDVSGTLQMDDASGTSVSGAGVLKFESGGRFVWARAAIINVPIAAWAAGSTCEIQNAIAGTPIGLGQNFHHFTWNFPAENTAISLAGNLTNVLGNLTILASANAANSVRFVASANTNNITVGGNVILSSGYLTMSGGSQANTVVNLSVAGNFIIANGAFLDNRASGANSVGTVIFNGGGQQYLTNSGGIVHSSGNASLNFHVGSGSTLNLAVGDLTLGNTTAGQDTVTVDGTLSFGTNKVTGAGTGVLTVNSGGQLIGDGTNELTTALNGINYAGTLSLPNHTFVANESFKLFDTTPANYTGAFTTFSPDPPAAGLTWITTALTTSGTLAVSSGVILYPTVGSAVQTLDGLVMSGSGGPPNHTYYLVSSPDVTALLGTWVTNATSAFDGSGNFSITNAIDPADPRRFFSIKYFTP